MAAGPAGNMYVPTDLLMPILADLIANGAVGGDPKPWIGLNTQASVTRGWWSSRVTPNSPAEKAGLRKWRPDHQYRWRRAEDAAGFLSEALVDG